MQRRELLIAATGAALGGAAPLFAARTRERDTVAQAPPSGTSDQRARWLATAESLKPSLSETDERPVALVRPVPDSALVLRFRMETEAPAAALGERLLGKGDSFILDFGGHRMGHLSFDLVGEGRGVDAPARLRVDRKSVV
jgi:alpha-L-rhamnosidase